MKHIYSKGKLDEVETRKYMRQIISSVDHLHRAGIIHRYIYTYTNTAQQSRQHNNNNAKYFVATEPPKYMQSC